MRLVILVSIALAVLLAASAVSWWLFVGKRPGRGKEEKDPKGAIWHATVELEELSERHPTYDASRLTVVLRDSKGKELETPGMAFELNGLPLTYSVSRGNYYDRHPYYRLREDSGFTFAAGTDYQLLVRQPGLPAVPFAAIRTPEPMPVSSFDLHATHRRDRDLVLSWKGLRQPAEILIYKTQTYVDDQGNQTIEAGGPYADDALRGRIGGVGMALREGRFKIPSSYLAGANGRVVTAIGIEITATTTGRFLFPVFARSTVTSQRKIVLRVDVVAPPEQ